MILLTGASGTVGTVLLPQLLSAGETVRALVRDPRRLGPQRVNVQIALGDLGDPHGLRHAMRGVERAGDRDGGGPRRVRRGAYGLLGLRAAHLADVTIPMLFLQGTRDALASLELLRPVVAGLGARATLAVFEHADHAFHVPARSGRTDTEVMEALLDAAAAWMAQ